jgi:hypothetical protein
VIPKSIILGRNFRNKKVTPNGLKQVLRDSSGVPLTEVYKRIDVMLNSIEIPEGVDVLSLSREMKRHGRVFLEDLTSGISLEPVRLPILDEFKGKFVRHPPKSLFPDELRAARDFRDTNLKLVVIEPCSSRWCHRFVFKREKSGIRVCSDLRDFKERSVWIYYSIPNIEDLLDELKGMV